MAPAGFNAEALKRIKGDSTEPCPIPDVWETWSREAEKWLRKHTNDKAKGNTGRGREPVFKKQTLSRPQVGALAYGGNVTLQRLRRREKGRKTGSACSRKMAKERERKPGTSVLR